MLAVQTDDARSGLYIEAQHTRVTLVLWPTTMQSRGKLKKGTPLTCRSGKCLVLISSSVFNGFPMTAYGECVELKATRFCTESGQTMAVYYESSTPG